MPKFSLLIIRLIVLMLKLTSLRGVSVPRTKLVGKLSSTAWPVPRLRKWRLTLS